MHGDAGEILAAHGSPPVLTSRENEGTAVTFHLPRYCGSLHTTNSVCALSDMPNGTRRRAVPPAATTPCPFTGRLRPRPRPTPPGLWEGSPLEDAPLSRCPPASNRPPLTRQAFHSFAGCGGISERDFHGQPFRSCGLMCGTTCAQRTSSHPALPSDAGWALGTFPLDTTPPHSLAEHSAQQPFLSCRANNCQDSGNSHASSPTQSPDSPAPMDQASAPAHSTGDQDRWSPRREYDRQDSATSQASSAHPDSLAPMVSPRPVSPSKMQSLSVACNSGPQASELAVCAEVDTSSLFTSTGRVWRTGTPPLNPSPTLDVTSPNTTTSPNPQTPHPPSSTFKRSSIDLGLMSLDATASSLGLSPPFPSSGRPRGMSIDGCRGPQTTDAILAAPCPVQPTILCVDDNAVNQLVISRMLQSAGMRVIKAMSGAEALTRLHNADRLPDLLILDVMMPGINGLDLCRFDLRYPLHPIRDKVKQRLESVGLPPQALVFAFSDLYCVLSVACTGLFVDGPAPGVSSPSSLDMVHVNGPK
jgi:CheY-like chemotaxis protein